MENEQWVAIAPAVAKHFWGEPTRKTQREIRWGSKGSKRLWRDTGFWRDYEHDKDGGVIDLVQFCVGTDKAGALEWLRREGYITNNSDRRNISRSKRRSGVRVSRHGAKAEQQRVPPKPKDKGTQEYGRTLWRESETVEESPQHPFRRWASQRNLLHPWCSVPFGIRWHSQRGIIVCGVFPLEKWRKDGEAEGIPVAVHLLAIDRDGNKRHTFGEQKDRDKNSLGPLSEGTFLLGLPTADRVNVVEGIADALAIYSREQGAVLATLGTSTNLRSKGNVIEWMASKDTWLYPDTDAGGDEGTPVIINSLLQRNPDAKLVRVGAGAHKDPGEWARTDPFKIILERYDFDEKSGILFDSGLPRAEADRIAVQTIIGRK